MQIIILLVLPKSLGGANYAKNLLRAAVLVQYTPRLFRFLPLLAGQSPSGFVFESAWANFIINLLTFMLSGHVVGSCWYLFGLQVGGGCYITKDVLNLLSFWQVSSCCFWKFLLNFTLSLVHEIMFSCWNFHYSEASFCSIYLLWNINCRKNATLVEQFP